MCRAVPADLRSDGNPADWLYRATRRRGMRYLIEVTLDAALDCGLVQEDKKAGEILPTSRHGRRQSTWKYFRVPASGLKASERGLDP